MMVLLQMLTEEYNGTTWTAGGNLNTARSRLAGAGIQTSALAFGGYFPTQLSLAATEEYDGSAWTTVCKFSNSKNCFRRSRNNLCRFSFWWYI
jgi:hypothetical protein